MVEEGKRIVYKIAGTLNFFALILTAIAFVTPYWFISWPRVFSTFRMIGLWEACFNGLILNGDPTQKAYYGCWWNLHPEFYAIRDWMMPPWFVIVQILITVTLMAELVNVFLMLAHGLATRPGTHKRPKYNTVQAITYIIVICAIATTAAVIIFGVAAYTDYRWMPSPGLNYLSWSYGLAVLSAIFELSAIIPMIIYNNQIREDFRKPPPKILLPPSSFPRSKV